MAKMLNLNTDETNLFKLDSKAFEIGAKWSDSDGVEVTILKTHTAEGNILATVKFIKGNDIFMNNFISFQMKYKFKELT